MRFPLVATCLFGLEHLLGEEIDALGYERINTMDGRVTFLGDSEAVALANVFLRYAERIYIKVGSFRAESFDELFEGTRRLPWSDFIGRNDAFPVKGHAIKSKLFSVPDCQAIVKKAIVRALEEPYGMTVFPEDGIKYQVEFFIFKDEATLMIDTSGVPLHKRGYRREANGAPIRETLAAAIAATSRPREDVLLWDPMCGSGTIVTNPPYGERLGTVREAERLYRDMGEHFRALSPWQVYVITSHEGFERLYGKRADKVRKLYNGMIPCYLYQYFKK